MVTGGGSWDISNHILNKPETFFAPPHAILYSGVGLALLGFVLLFVAWKKSGKLAQFRNGIKITTIGIVSLLSAGPIDFTWHSKFGLDGLLSPPHLVLIAGMGLTSIGALMNTKSLYFERPNKIAIILSMIPGFASVAYPFLVSTILVSSALFAKNRFGVASIVGAIYLVIMTMSAVIPNHTLIPTIPFYSLNIVPILLGDYVLSRSNTSKGMMIAGAVFGSAFYFLYYPLITYTYNEITLDKLMWPSLTSIIYFEMVPIVAPLLIISGSIVGAIAVKFAQKISYSKLNNR
ncbi:MAG: hypothetical protein EB164_05410 [Thaumarchaeota archaeon]|nr:hypothetical protein [Nitrososphaerota archaeon]